MRAKSAWPPRTSSDNSSARRVFDPARYDFHFSSRAHTQRVGFAYRKGLELERHPDLVQLARVHSERLRYGVDVTIRRGDRSVRLLVVHLKSGCFSSPLDGPINDEDDAKACRKLAAQLPVLERWIHQRVEAREPFVILGDFNRRFLPQDDVWARLSGAHPGAGLGAPTRTERSRCWEGRYPDFIDHFVLDARARVGLEPDAFEQLLYTPEDRRRHGDRLSDHCPARLRLR